jgi:hypothetical protein
MQLCARHDKLDHEFALVSVEVDDRGLDLVNFAIDMMKDTFRRQTWFITRLSLLDLNDEVFDLILVIFDKVFEGKEEFSSTVEGCQELLLQSNLML